MNKQHIQEEGKAPFPHPAGGADNRYEFHLMREGMPVIFHHDEVLAGCVYTANWHENLELLYFTEGSGTVICEDERTAVCAGDVCIIDSGLLHRVESDSEVRYDCLIVDDDFCKRNGLYPTVARFSRVTRDETLRRLYHDVAEAYLGHDPLREPAVRGEVLRLMVYLMRKLRLPGENAPPRSSAGVRLAIGYLRSHYGEEIDLDQLSAVVGISKYHFIREFKRITGQTVITYLNLIRIEQAARMIREENAPVSMTASACGFSSHSYFSKVFFRLRGMLPSAFAERCRRERGEER